MNGNIVVAVISGVCVAVPSLIATVLTYHGNTKKSEENKNLTIYRIDQLEDKVNKHNNLIDRMYKVESRVTLLEDEIKK